MSADYGSMQLGPGSGYRFATHRKTGTSRRQSFYPNPFFDIAQTYLPTTTKELFRWCRFYAMTNPLIATVTYKLASYPITELLYETDNEGSKRRWMDLFENQFQIRPFIVEANLDRHTYGNSFVSVSFPFRKFLKCRACKKSVAADRAKYRFRNFEFHLECENCGSGEPAEVEDRYQRSVLGIRLVRWNPENLIIRHNEITGQRTYFYEIPLVVKNDIVIGRPQVVETTPQPFIEALQKNKAVVIKSDHVFHSRNPSVSRQDAAWGMPRILPVLKDVFYLQVLKRAQECVAPETLLETSRGLVPAGSVAVGDRVKSLTGGMVDVTRREVRPMIRERGDFAVRVTLSGLRQLPSVFSDNHPLWVLRGTAENKRDASPEHRRSSYVLKAPHRYEFDWTDAGELEVGRYVGYPTARSRDAVSVDVATYVPTNGIRTNKTGPERKALPGTLPLDEDLAYVAGWYVGDGCSSEGKNQIDFCLSPKDDSSALQGALERVVGHRGEEYPYKNAEGRLLTVYDSAFSRFIRGWIPGKSQDKQIPEEIRSAPDSIVLAFLRGYLEADGYWKVSARNDERIMVCCSNGQLTYQLWTLALSLGCISTLREGVSKDVVITKKDGSEQFIAGGRPVHFWTVCSKSARRLHALMFGGDVEEVKSGKSGFFFDGHFAARVHAVDRVECSEVISFEVGGDHTFCTPGTATHNSIFFGHILPMKILFPAPSGGAGGDPYNFTNLSVWKDRVASEIQEWRRDSLYIPILPIPVGYQSIGGDGKNLQLSQEIRTWSEHIVTGLGVPLELVFGGLSYSGSSVSLRILENEFLSLREDNLAMVRFVRDRIAEYLGWEKPDLRFKPFKMADDLQRAAFDFQLVQANKLSTRTLLENRDYDFDRERDLIETEADFANKLMRKQQVFSYETQGQGSVITARYQVKAQEIMSAATAAMQGQMGGQQGPSPEQMQGGEGQPREGQTQDPAAGQQPQQGSPTPGGNGTTRGTTGMGGIVGVRSPLTAGNVGMVASGGTDMTAAAQAWAKKVNGAPDQEKGVLLGQLKATSPELYALVLEAMNQPDGSTGKPLPEQRAPRRGPGAALV